MVLPLERLMLHYKSEILKKYGDKTNPKSETGTFVYKDGRPVMLNPYRIGIWSRALVRHINHRLIHSKKLCLGIWRSNLVAPADA